ncbi:hypothetical protein SK128_019517, partial [Halocaridina rubra]
ASEEEELVVDDIAKSVDNVSKRIVSVPSATVPSVSLKPRQRTESMTSVAGPCLPPDLLLDTGLQQTCKDDDTLDGVQQENVFMEFATIHDGELPLEDSMIITDNDLLDVPNVKIDADNTYDIEHESIQGAYEVIAPTTAKSEAEEKQLCEETCITSKNLEDNSLCGGFRNVAELVDKKTEGFFCQKVDTKRNLSDKFHIEDKDVKLPAGSIILAVVSESGSLVPLPQMHVKENLVKAMALEDSGKKFNEEEIDVETVTEKTPVLEAGDVDSLLAEFEASENVNTSSIAVTNQKTQKYSSQDKKRCDIEVPGKCSNQNERKGNKSEIYSINSAKKNKQEVQNASIIASSIGKKPRASPTHQKIKDSLPKEIIEKIKASAKRKSNLMLSEPIVVLKGRGVKAHEANQANIKAHKVPHQASTHQVTSDQRVPPPLDHDYCFSPDKQRKHKCSDSNLMESEEYLNKLPDYCMDKISNLDNQKKLVTDDMHDERGKKDSGVESGDVSDASVEPEDRRKDRTFKCESSVEKIMEDIYNKLPPYMTDIGNAKPKVGEVEEESLVKEESKYNEGKQETKKIKRKLNLSEYRKRIQSAQNSRCPSPAQTDSKASSNEPLSIGELIQKMKEAEEQKLKDAQEDMPLKVLNENVNCKTVSSPDVEEGELQGDSESENSNSNVQMVLQEMPKQSDSTNTSDIKKDVVLVPFTSPSSVTSSLGRERCKSKPLGYTSHRWSSSSHSRSRSRSPNEGKRKSGSSQSRRSSRGRRMRPSRNSGSSVSPCRSWSRSRSRSGGRVSSDSSYCSTCSCSSLSQSRSRSRSAKRKDRGYRRHYSRRHSRNRDRQSSRSRSRSTYRYSRVTRSRSPSWRNSNRSVSPTRRCVQPYRREDDTRLKEVEERRVIYVGRISEGTTKIDLRRRFQKFGTILDISVHFRECGNNYGFVTFKNKDEAYDAVEHGNDDPAYPRYDLCFGGRRAFCRVQYSDLDAQNDDPYYNRMYGGKGLNNNADFDSLLRAAMKKKTR